MIKPFSRWPAVGMMLAVVLWQVSSCCCCLGGANSPPANSMPPDPELAQDLRTRFNEATAVPGPVTLEATDQELTSYVVGLLQSGEGEFPARDMQIRFGDGYVEIWATFIEIAPTDVPVYVRGTVTAESGQLVFTLLEANAGPFPIPGAMRESIAQSFSETLAEASLGLTVDEVQIEPGRAVLTGQVTGKVPPLP